MVCPKTSSNPEKKKIVEEAGEKGMKLRAKLRQGNTTCQMGGWMDRHWGWGEEEGEAGGNGGRLGRRSAVHTLSYGSPEN
jgi:hypothetical protein